MNVTILIIKMSYLVTFADSSSDPVNYFGEIKQRVKDPQQIQKTNVNRGIEFESFKSSKSKKLKESHQLLLNSLNPGKFKSKLDSPVK